MLNKVKKYVFGILSIIGIIVAGIVFMHNYQSFTVVQEEMNRVGYDTIYFTVEDNNVTEIKKKITSNHNVNMVYSYPSILLMDKGKLEGVEIRINDELHTDQSSPTSVVAVVPYYFEDGYDINNEKIFVSLNLADYLNISNHIGPDEYDIMENTKISIKTKNLDNYDLIIDGIVDNYYCAPYDTSFVILVPHQQLQNIQSHDGRYALYPVEGSNTKNITEQLQQMTDNIQIIHAKDNYQDVFEKILKNNIMMMAGCVGVVCLVIGVNIWYLKRKNNN